MPVVFEEVTGEIEPDVQLQSDGQTNQAGAPEREDGKIPLRESIHSALHILEHRRARLQAD